MTLCPEHLHLDQQLCFAVYSTSLSMTKAYKPLLKALNLTYPQYLVLCALWQSAPTGMNVGELGEALCLDSGTLTPLLKRMETQGLLTRQRSTHDERVVEVRLTKTGTKLQTKVANIPLQLGCAIGLTERQRNELVKTLTHVRTALLTHSDADSTPR